MDFGTTYQFHQLNELPCRKFILATDSDSAGMVARKRIKEKIKGKLVTEIVLPTNRKDINECTDEEIKNFYEKF